MKVQPKKIPIIFAASITLLAVALLAFFAVASATNSSSPVTAPCPASWYPLANQPRTIQMQCSALKEQALKSWEATEAAGPHSNVVDTPDAALVSEFARDKVTAIAAFSDVQLTEPIRWQDIFQGYSAHANPVTSVWQVGMLPGGIPDVYLKVIVYAAGPSQMDGNGSIYRLLMGTTDPQEPQATQYNSAWPCPRNIGNLTITGITGQNGILSFTSDSGVSGTLDMSSGTWAFSTP